MLLGRANESKYLENLYQKEGSQILVLYGKEGVGKTSLLLDFVKDKEYDYFLAGAVSEKEQLLRMGAEWGCEPSYDSVFEKIQEKHCRKKVVIIDEFHHAVRNSFHFMDEFLKLIRGNWENRSVLLVLASSAFWWVENDMVSQMGQAAYEISGFLKLRELSFLDIVRFFPDYSTKECMRIYAVCGGVPGLWSTFDRKLSADENIIKNIVSRDGVLFDRALSEICEKLREPAVYHSILSRMACGADKLNDIFNETGFSRAKISVYLKNLMEIEMVSKVYSAKVKGNENAKKGIYRIDNHLVDFYFRFIFPHLSATQYMEGREFFDRFIKDDMRSFEAGAYKDVCREFIALLARADKLPVKVEEVGSWCGKVGDIDILALGENGNIAGICCWDKDILTFEDYEWLLFCLKQAKVEADHIYMFSGDDFDDRLKALAAQNAKVTLIDPKML